jgi:glycosyltransferase involved in cell wall biosynthesis
MRIAMIGTRGVPARYGGFETCIEEVGRRLAARGHHVRVYCRGENVVGDSYLGMELVHRPALKRKSLETLSHTALSAEHVAVHPVDVALLFNAANAPFLPVLRARRIPVATHVDGLEWKRAKWGANGRRYYRSAESLAVRWSDALIADAQGIADYYTDEFGAPTELISYGAPILNDLGDAKLAEVGLTPHGYHLVVARFEPENHVSEIVEGFVASRARLPLVVVGSAPYADEYTAQISAAADDRVRLLGGIWDQDLLDQLWANSLTYLHGHSVGGTNPALLRAIGAGAATIAFDVSFNREVLGDSGEFFSDAASVSALVEAAERDPAAAMLRGKASQERAAGYDWDDVAEKYERLCERLASAPRGSVRRPSGRRQRAAHVRDQPAERHG